MKAEGKIEIDTFGAKDVPQVKILGAVEVKDFHMIQFALRKAIMEYFSALGKDELNKKLDEEKENKENVE
jgi:hypothetical protein